MVCNSHSINVSYYYCPNDNYYFSNIKTTILENGVGNQWHERFETVKKAIILLEEQCTLESEV